MSYFHVCFLAHAVLEDRVLANWVVSVPCVCLWVTSRAVFQLLPRSGSGGIALGGNGGFYNMCSSSDDIWVWLRVNHCSISSEYQLISFQIYEFFAMGEQDSQDTVGGCWAACLHPAWGCWGASSLFPECVPSFPQSASLAPESWCLWLWRVIVWHFVARNTYASSLSL